MSNEEITLQIRTGNAPLIKTLIGCAIAICSAIFFGSREISNVLYDIKNLKEWKVEAVPELKTLRSDVSSLQSNVSVLNNNMTIINSKLKIK